jgi:thiol-disulfide isomerase/thioredoxin
MIMHGTGGDHVGVDRREWLVGLAGLGGLAAAVRAAAAPPTAPGQALAWPALTLLDGRTLGADDWHDTAGVLVFWATWCAYCRRLNARIDRLHRQSVGTRLRVLGAAVDGDDASVRQYLQSQGFSFPAVVVGASGLRERFTSRRVIPMTCLVDRAGMLRQVIHGEMSEDDVMGLVRLADPAR